MYACTTAFPVVLSVKLTVIGVGSAAQADDVPDSQLLIAHASETTLGNLPRDKGAMLEEAV